MKTKLVTLILAAIALAGCQSPSVNSVENAQKTGRRSVIVDKRIITGRGFNSDVAIVALNTAMTPGGVLQVQVELLNRTDSLQRFNYTFEWFDLNGMQINNTLTATIPGQIQAGEDKFISAVAPNVACRDFRLKLIRAQ